MRLTAATATLVVMLSWLCPPAWAAPPTRPAPLTAEQFHGLKQIESQPDHASAVKLHASFGSEKEKNLEATRLSDDVWTVVYSGGLPALIIVLLICAAPL